MSEFKVTQRVIDLVQDLFRAGYEGTAELTSCGCSGTEAVLHGAFAMQLSGFCKESLHITEHEDGRIFFVGRYNLEFDDESPTVDDIVSCAWNKYLTYKGRGYSMPDEFKALFISKGYIKEVTRTVTEWVEQ